LVRSSEEKGNLRGKGEGSEEKEQQRTDCTPRKRRTLKDKEKQSKVPELLRCGDLDYPLGREILCMESVGKACCNLCTKMGQEAEYAGIDERS
jgi:hypothetical protein